MFMIIVLISIQLNSERRQVHDVPSAYSPLQKLNKYISWKARSFYVEENRDRK